jgi:serine O-acetyltransferase
MYENLKDDLVRLSGRPASALRILYYYNMHNGFCATSLYRLAHWFSSRAWPRLSILITRHMLSRTGAEILPAAHIGPGLVIRHPAGIVIGSEVNIGARCTLMQGVTLGERYSPRGGKAYPTVGDDVTLCTNSVVLGGVRIGDNAIVGAHSLVLTDIPSNVVAIGVPARCLPRGATSLQTRNY